MRFSTLTFMALALAAGAGAAFAASDDLTIVSKHIKDGKPAGVTTSYLASDHVRMGSSEGHEMIVDLKSGTMTTLDVAKKTYYTVTKEDMKQLQAKMQEQMNTPEMKQAREAMASMGGGSMGGLFDVKKLGTSRKVAGFSCEEWTITMGAMSTIKECVTSDLQYPVHAWDAFKEFSEGMKNMMSAFGPMANAGADLAEKLKAMKGFPVATATSLDIMGHKSTSETEVTEVRKGSIPASAWEIPAGYTKVENPMLKAFDRKGRGRPEH
jgi:hypothetical protein